MIENKIDKTQLTPNQTTAIQLDVVEGCTLLVDKPLYFTSFDVVNKLKFAIQKVYKIKDLKIGHGGTLDPRATGLLVICLGKHTKRLAALQNLPKEYIGTMFLGATTPSYDTESAVDKIYPVDHISEQLMQDKIKDFHGVIEQVPPAYSAIKVNGHPAYKSARKGKPLQLNPRKIEILSFDILHHHTPLADFKVYCSKGTYIRSLIHDFGQALQSGAYLKSLTRTKIGPFSLSTAWSLEALIKAIEAAGMDMNRT